jgi:hypothetical protein
MMIFQMFVALNLAICHLGNPATFLHDLLGTVNGVFIAVVSIDMIGVGDEVGIVNISPPISISDEGNVPSGVVYCSGNELAELHGL